MSDKRSKSLVLAFDEAFTTCRNEWESIRGELKNHPDRAVEDLEALIAHQQKILALTLAMSRCDAEELFSEFKKWIEKEARLGVGLEGYSNVNSIPQAHAGFLYTCCAVMSFNNESWKLLEQLLDARFELHRDTRRSTYAYGFSHSHFFHTDVFNRSASVAHDFYRKQMAGSDVVQVTGLSGEDLTDAYVRTQFLMSLKGAQLIERNVSVRVWADFGRYYGERVESLLNRMMIDDAYATGVCRLFHEDRDTFMQKVNDRLHLIHQHFWGGGGNFLWESLQSWDPSDHE